MSLLQMSFAGGVMILAITVIRNLSYHGIVPPLPTSHRGKFVVYSYKIARAREKGNLF